jgi:protoporphyrinogen oxidase
MAEATKAGVVVLGAGPAGLTAAYELLKRTVPVTVLERDPRYVGGIARTVEHRGFRFDIGGHRFFSKNPEIEDLWTEILENEMLTCGRLSRIYYSGRYFDYPLKATNALLNLGPVETLRCMASYARARIWPVSEPQTFEDWVSNQFGKRLFSIFFKSYTEKVWGMSTRELSADWAAQRIKGLDMGRVLRNALLPKRRVGGADAVIKTLIDRFRYPRLGPGQMWERIRDLLAHAGQPVRMGEAVERVVHGGGRVHHVLARNTDGEVQAFAGEHFVSSLPVRSLIRMLDPAPPAHVRQAAESLRYRDFLTVALMIDRADLFPDNWIYIHDPLVKVGRIQNFKNWSPTMVPDPAQTCLGLEYFCFEGDGLWTSTDEELIELGRQELERLAICSSGEVFDGAVVRQLKAYPVYDDAYQRHIAVIREFMAELPNLQLIGRNGMHHYNNQDHSMMTGLLAARNIALDESFDLWKVNGDAEYLEEVREGDDLSGRLTPHRVSTAAVKR